jgi:hypothetical protein
MNENLSGAPLYSNGYRSGATVLKGTSDQTFGKLPPITDIDTNKITDVSVRLVVDRYSSDRIYPLSGARSVPPRIDSDGQFGQFGQFGQYSGRYSDQYSGQLGDHVTHVCR